MRRIIPQSNETWVDFRIDHLELMREIFCFLEELVAVVPAKVGEHVPDELPLQDSAHEALGERHEEGWRLHVDQE